MHGSSFIPVMYNFSAVLSMMYMRRVKRPLHDLMLGFDAAGGLLCWWALGFFFILDGLSRAGIQ